MLKQADILTAARDKLKTIYPSFPIYLDEVKKNFISPCFFLKLVRVTTPQSKTMLLNNCTLYITYFTIKNQNLAIELYDIKDTVIETFWQGLQVEDRFIKFATVTTDTNGTDADIVTVNLPFMYYDAIPSVSTDYLIENIYSNEQIRK